MKKVTLYLETYYDEEKRVGGYCVSLSYVPAGGAAPVRKDIEGREDGTTRSRLYAIALQKGLEALKKPVIVDLVTSSAYVYSALNGGWMSIWEKNDWKKANGDVADNAKLWRDISFLANPHKLNCRRVPLDAEKNAQATFLNETAARARVRAKSDV